MIDFVGPTGALQIFGIKLIGFNAENGKKLLFSIAVIVAALLINAALRGIFRLILRGSAEHERRRFWIGQGLKVFTAAVVIIGTASVWFDDPTRLTTAVGLVSAGLAFALQRVVTAIAGYFVILRGDVFSVGDRIVMGGVRGDVIALNFTQTTIMEMGQSPAEQGDSPAMWVRARQYTGRIVNVSNARIFDEPVYNYTREFPFVWEELSFRFDLDVKLEEAEAVIRAAADRHTVKSAEMGEEALAEMERRYFMRRSDLKPHVYWRLDKNKVEMTCRFIVEESRSRQIKDHVIREVVEGFRKTEIRPAA